MVYFQNVKWYLDAEVFKFFFQSFVVLDLIIIFISNGNVLVYKSWG